MKLLEDRIIKYGKIGEGNVLKVDSFVNHQIDVNFMNEVGKEFFRLFKDEKIDKILTKLSICTIIVSVLNSTDTKI